MSHCDSNMVPVKYWGNSKNGLFNNTENGCLGPIFFYTGNEGAIELFWQNTGFVTDVSRNKSNFHFFHPVFVFFS